MKTVRTKNRKNYVYHYSDGSRIVLEPGRIITINSKGKFIKNDSSITEEYIRKLHSYDDEEVKNNLKHINCETESFTEERIRLKKKWDINHPNQSDNPYEKPMRVVHLDSFGEDDKSQDDKSEYLLQAFNNEHSEEYEDERILLIRKIVNELPSSMKTLYQLLYIEGLSQSDICKKLGLSKSTVSERTKTLINKIKEKILK